MTYQIAIMTYTSVNYIYILYLFSNIVIVTSVN